MGIFKSYDLDMDAFSVAERVALYHALEISTNIAPKSEVKKSFKAAMPCVKRGKLNHDDRIATLIAARLVLKFLDEHPETAAKDPEMHQLLISANEKLENMEK